MTKLGMCAINDMSLFLCTDFDTIPSSIVLEEVKKLPIQWKYIAKSAIIRRCSLDTVLERFAPIVQQAVDTGIQEVISRIAILVHAMKIQYHDIPTMIDQVALYVYRKHPETKVHSSLEEFHRYYQECVSLYTACKPYIE